MDSRNHPPARREGEGSEFFLERVGRGYALENELPPVKGEGWPSEAKKEFLEETGKYIVAGTEEEDLPNGPNWEWVAMEGLASSQSAGQRFYPIWDAIDGLVISESKFWSHDGMHGLSFYEGESQRNKNLGMLEVLCLVQFINDDFGPLPTNADELDADFYDYVWPFVNHRKANVTSAYDVYRNILAMRKEELDGSGLEMHIDVLKSRADKLPENWEPW